jgi:hypothetical protein
MPQGLCVLAFSCACGDAGGSRPPAGVWGVPKNIYLIFRVLPSAEREKLNKT